MAQFKLECVRFDKILNGMVALYEDGDIKANVAWEIPEVCGMTELLNKRVLIVLKALSENVEAQ